MKVFLTGGTGYVGSRVAARLQARGDHVTALARNSERAAALPAGVAPTIADLSEVDRLAEAAADADAVIHTGFVTHGENWFEAVAIEARLIRAFVAAVQGSPRRLIVSNGTGFYGDSQGRFLDETTRPPADHPAFVRVAATAPATSDPSVEGMELRLASFVHGYGGSVFLPILVAAARRSGESLYVGAGENRVSAVHVDAAADAYVAALDRGRRGQIYHIASDDAPPMRDLAQAIAVATGARLKSVSREEAAERLDPFTAMFLALDNSLSSAKARRDLEWSPAGHPSLLWDVAHGSY